MEKSANNVIWPDAQVESTEALSFGRRHVLRRKENGHTVRESVLEVSMPESTEKLMFLREKGIGDDALREIFNRTRNDLEWELTMFKSISHRNLAPVEEFVIRDNVTAPGWKCFVRSKLYEKVENGSLDEKESLRLAASLCSAVAELNRAGMVHGDICPSNIGRDESGEYVLSGFGVRRCIETPDTMTEDDGFDAPEVRMKGHYSVLSDLYSIGRVLTVLSGENAEDEVRAIAEKAACADAAKRFQSPSELMQAIEEALLPESERIKVRREREIREAKKAKNIEQATAALEAKKAREAEAARKAEEAKLAEKARVAEENASVEEERKATEAAALLAEEVRKAREKREEETRLAEESGLAEKVRKSGKTTPEEEPEIVAGTEKVPTEKSSDKEADVMEKAKEAPAEPEKTEETGDMAAEIPEKPKKKVKAWLFILIAVLLVAAAAAFYFRPWEDIAALEGLSAEEIAGTSEPKNAEEAEPENSKEAEAANTGETVKKPASDAYDHPDIDKETGPEKVELPEEPGTETGPEETEPDPADENEFDMHSNRELIAPESLAGMNRYESYMVINSVYARHGKIFKTKSIQEYFEAQSWYEPVSRDSNAVIGSFNEYEMKNLKTVVDYQIGQGFRKGI